jgi:hypothetical protein
MPPSLQREWLESEWHDVQHELSQEHPNVSITLISKAVSDAQAIVPPQDGRVKLLIVARKILAGEL